MSWDITSTGSEISDAEVDITIGPKFLELFSEQLYTSPNKTFEELVSNSWDAQATKVRIGMSRNLKEESAAVWVLDNGESMDVNGFKQLWSVAKSNKDDSSESGRRPIGKFGIGKLATYVLAHELTYICKATDGIIRAVQMDYRRIGGDKSQLHIDPLPLPVQEFSTDDVATLLRSIADGGRIIGDLRELARSTTQPNIGMQDEFGGEQAQAPKSGSTWTLAILTTLKPSGKNMQQGRIRRMLMASLPLGASISITYNGELLESTKEDIPISEQWLIGPGLDMKQLRLSKDEVIDVEEYDDPYPHVRIGELGIVSGTVTLYDESISGGKSEELQYSNGFFVNILGRVINAGDPYFGLENLNHAAWAKFRAAIRADSLNDQLAINREGVLDSSNLIILRVFLRALFNRARTTYDRKTKAAWPDAGDVLTEAWGTVPLEPLQREVEEGLTSGSMPSFTVNHEEEVSPEDLDRWNEVKTPADVIEEISFASLGVDECIVSYDVGQRKIIINEDHPFVREHATTHEQQLLLRDFAMVDLLTQAYSNHLGIDKSVLSQVDLYRDQLLRLVARLRRRSGFQIAELLDLASYNKNDKALETILGDALESLGYTVRRLGGKGNPEGVASAFITRDRRQATYSFTYDAKSSQKKKVAAKDASLSGLVRHRTDHDADYVLVVGPAFADGAMQQECRIQKVTPMEASDLGALVILNATMGPISLVRLRDLFALHSEAEVHDFIEGLAEEIQQARRDHLSYAELFAALDRIGYEGPDMLTTPVIAKEIRDRNDTKEKPTKRDVFGVLQGLSILAPHLVRVQGDNVFLGARPDKLRETIVRQINSLPSDYRFGGQADLMESE